LRDPRAIYVSDEYRRHKHPRKPYVWMMKVPLLLESYLLVLTVVQWRRAIQRHYKLKKRYPDKYRLVRFEDVVKRPTEVVPELFDFLGVQSPADPTAVNVPSRHGMRDTSEGLDPAAADRWNERIHPVAKRFLELFLGGPMRRFGYVR
jgi:hypothetical protein